MTISEFLVTIESNMPHDIPDSTIINWINILEDSVYSSIVGTLNTEPFISDDGLSERERIKPEFKTIDKANEQTLSLLDFGFRWLSLYEYFVYAQICILKEEFAKSNNYIYLYNSVLDDFISFYFSRVKTDKRW